MGCGAGSSGAVPAPGKPGVPRPRDGHGHDRCTGDDARGFDGVFGASTPETVRPLLLTLVGADCDSRMGMEEVVNARLAENQVHLDCLPRRPESDQSALIGCEYPGTVVAGRQAVQERPSRRRLPDRPRPRLGGWQHCPVVMDVLPPHTQRLGPSRARAEREALQTPDERKHVWEVLWRLGLKFEWGTSERISEAIKSLPYVRQRSEHFVLSDVSTQAIDPIG